VGRLILAGVAGLSIWMAIGLASGPLGSAGAGPGAQDAPGAQVAAPETGPTPVVDLSTSSPDDPAEQARQRPLLLEVSISNPVAANSQARDVVAQSARAALTAGGRLASMAPAERQALEALLADVPTPSVVLGSADRPVWSLVTFEVRDDAGTVVTWPIRPLASARDLTGAVTLSAGPAAVMAFGMDAADFRNVSSGRYHVRAQLVTDTESGMWRGHTASDDLTIDVVDAPRDGSPAAVTRLDYLEGQYDIVDRHFDEALACADRILARDSSSLWGLVLRGDGFFAQNRLDDAERAYLDALTAFEAWRATQTSLPTDGDSPTYILAQLAAIRDRR
jgi:hypothetical protein